MIAASTPKHLVFTTQSPQPTCWLLVLRQGLRTVSRTSRISNFDLDPLPLPIQYLGEDLLSLIVVAIVGVGWVFVEVGGLLGWVAGISLVVGVEVVEMV